MIDSERYWQERYLAGGNSGEGSYGGLAKFKSEIINKFVEDNNIKTVIEYGCGDGNQLQLGKYENYLGLDVSPECVKWCKNIFSGDGSKQFKLMSEYDNEFADLTLSLDVIYHLIEEEIYEAYMNRLFSSANQFVITYSSNRDIPNRGPHVKHRNFSSWVNKKIEGWELIQNIPNKFADKTYAEFFIYQKEQS